MVLEPEYISCHKIRPIGPVVWPVDREQTDKQNKQTYKQTNRQTAVTNILRENQRFRKVINSLWTMYLFVP